MHRVDYELDLNYKRQTLKNNSVFSTKNKSTQIQSKYFNKAL